jgi:CheY-like chemotaxis protein
VDCIVLDYQMPGMSGIDMARQLRASDGIRDTPIVLLTSVDQSLAPRLNGELRIDAQLTKPARSSALLEAVVETIQKRRGKLNPTEEPAWSEGTGLGPSAPQRPAAFRDGSRHGCAGDAQAASSRPSTPPGRHPRGRGQRGQSARLHPDPVGDRSRLRTRRQWRQAVEAWSEMKPRMILMDVSMPEMNGLEATGRSARWKSRPIGAHPSSA